MPRAATERRTTAGTIEIRASNGTGLGALGGYALKFNTLSQNLGGYVESCAPGLVDAGTLRGERGDVVARFQHDDVFLLGRLSSGSLALRTDGIGLDYTVDLPETSYARDIGALAARGDLRHSSFAFRTLEDDWAMTDQGFPLRELRSIQLVDVAPVVNPAYLDTSTGLRSLAEKRGLDFDAVTKAAEQNELGTLLRERDPKIIDLGQGDTHPKPAILLRRLVSVERQMPGEWIARAQ
jgi:uncharacterized protein